MSVKPRTTHHWYRSRVMSLVLCALLAASHGGALVLEAAAAESETYEFVTEWGPDYDYYAPGELTGYPAGLAADADGYVYVTVNDTIEKRTSDGELVTGWGSTGSESGEFDWPQGIAVDGDGYVYVADTMNNRVQKFTSAGTFVAEWGESGSGDGQFAGLWDVAIGPDGSVYVSDSGNSRIQKFTSTGTFVTAWGEYGMDPGEFQFPWGVAVDSDGYVYVVDGYSERIQKFTSAGVFVTEWGSTGSGEGEFLGVTDVAAGADGFIYVTDSSNYRVQKFTSAGAFVAEWGTQGEETGMFEEPTGIVVGSNGHVYVADTTLGRVTEFSSVGEFISMWMSLDAPVLTPRVFDGPLGLAVDEEGLVWVSDGDARDVVRFSSDGDGETLWQGGFDDPFLIWGLKGVAAGQDGYVYVLDSYYVTHYDGYGNPDYQTTDFRVQKVDYYGSVVNEASVAFMDAFPSDAAIAVSGAYAYVVVTEDHTVCKLDADGLVADWGGEGSGSGQFYLPGGVAVGPDGSVYVADSGNDRIQKFTSAGAYVSEWGGSGSAEGQFNAPIGIAVDGDGDVFVADAGNHRVQKFTSTGTFLTAWGTEGSGEGQFSFPISVAVDSEGDVYVADEADRIQRFSPQSVSVNSPPVLTAIGPQSVNELSALTFTATATDANDDPLTFSLGVGAPSGAGITSGGAFSWMPSEAQGPGTYDITVVVSDGQGGTDSEQFEVTVAEVNIAPTITTIADKSVNELSLLSFSASAIDPDLPANTLTFSLGVGAPSGAGITSGGVFSWTPSEAQGPGTYEITVVVSDGKGGTDSEVFSVDVAEVSDDNRPPSLDPIGDKTVDELSLLSFTASATDLDGDSLTFSLGAGAPDGAAITSGGNFTWTPSEAQGPGTYEITVVVSDGYATDSETITVTVNEVADALVVTPISGLSRYDTAIEASKKAFPVGVTATVDGYRNVVVATGKNWPDALGGASLAGALECPILLTDPATLPATVAAEIERLGATRAVVLGGEGAVSPAVYAALDALDGVSVKRVAGTSRYQTAYDVAEETVRVLEAKGDGYDGTAFVATGRNFPDALGASPIAAAKGWPLYLVDPVAGLTPELQAALSGDSVTDVIALGGTVVVPASVLSDIASATGASTERWAGSDRYDTARIVATHGVDDCGLTWDKVALATGANFPDALSGGALQGRDGSVMLLTSSTSLYPGVASTLSANKASIHEVRFLGGTSAISDAVRAAVVTALE